jgi:hypothetical protein
MQHQNGDDKAGVDPSKHATDSGPASDVVVTSSAQAADSVQGVIRLSDEDIFARMKTMIGKERIKVHPSTGIIGALEALIGKEKLYDAMVGEYGNVVPQLLHEGLEQTTGSSEIEINRLKEENRQLHEDAINLADEMAKIGHMNATSQNVAAYIVACQELIQTLTTQEHAVWHECGGATSHEECMRYFETIQTEFGVRAQRISELLADIATLKTNQVAIWQRFKDNNISKNEVTSHEMCIHDLDAYIAQYDNAKQRINKMGNEFKKVSEACGLPAATDWLTLNTQFPLIDAKLEELVIKAG